MEEITVEDGNSKKEKVEEKSVLEKPLNLLEWIGSLFLLLIPGINVITAIVFLCQKKKSRNRFYFILASFVIILSTCIIFLLLYFILGPETLSSLFKNWKQIFS